MCTGRVTLKLLVAGLLVGGASLAQQNWEIGGGVGYGWYRAGSITSSAGTADAGIRNAVVATGVVTEDMYQHFSGEFRYVYHPGDAFLSSGAVQGAMHAQSHSFSYDVLWHLKPKASRLRPFAAGGVGAKYYESTGEPPNPQPLPKIAGLTARSDWKPLFNFGIGVKYRVTEHIVVRGDFRDYLSLFPAKLFSPAGTGTTPGVLHQFTPMFGIGYGF
jgi:hypothetical protein